MRGDRVRGDVGAEHNEANDPADNTYHHCGDAHHEIATTRPVTNDYADQPGQRRPDAQQPASSRHGVTGHKKMGAQALLAYGNAHLERSSSE